MITWLSQESSNVLSSLNATLLGFDTEKDSKFSPVTIILPTSVLEDPSLPEDECATSTLYLGDTRSLSPSAIDRRFRASLLSLAISTESKTIYSALDSLLASPSTPSKVA